jgi:hypothetical protein
MNTPLMGVSTNDPQPPALCSHQGARRRARDSRSPTVGDLDLDDAGPDRPVHPDRSVSQGFGMANRVGNQLGDHDLGFVHDGRVNVELTQ